MANKNPLESIKRPGAYASGYENIPTRHRIEQNSFVGNIIVQLQMRKTDAEPYYKNCLVPAQR